jgi:hypothetical protein
MTIVDDVQGRTLGRVSIELMGFVYPLAYGLSKLGDQLN